MPLLPLLAVFLAPAALAAPAERTARVDEAGVLRWQDDGSEVALFGVNYYVPFAIDYHQLGLRGIDRDQCIREDVAHFARLGLTAIRLHCWDREMSDAEGNLQDNEHLRLLDLLISECARRGIYSVMTPIAWWGTPEDETGFSSVYPMHQMTRNPQAWQAQANYLRQYLNHVNRYTGQAYKDDPAIVALELINEPTYDPDIPDETVTQYINTLCAAVRETGCRKPIFYNCWGPKHKAAAASTLDGVSFGWYPTGLASGAALRGNYLPRVDDYPSMRDPLLATKAKIIYEFDAADVPGTVMYPAMARAFRSGGAQIATQFQYDVTALADTNVNWQTHYLNLIYTPGKALSLAIAAEVFRSTPRLKLFGAYPDNLQFSNCRLDPAADLSEYVTADSFLYANDTPTVPPRPERLARLWGRGSSPLVTYEGTGAYFLDRLAPGVWQLQVYPDAVPVADAYAGGSKEKTRVLWQSHRMSLRLPDLGDGFRLARAGGDDAGLAQTGPEVRVRPGNYLLLRAGVPPPDDVTLTEFIAPPSSEAPSTAFLEAPPTWREGKPLTVRATVAAPGDAGCTLHLQTAGRDQFALYPMQRARAYEYTVTVPAGALRAGRAHLALTVETAEGTLTFPGGRPEAPEASTPAPRQFGLLRLAGLTEAPPARYTGPAGRAFASALVPGRGPDHRALRLEAEGFGETGCISAEVPVDQLPEDIGYYNAVSVVARGGPNTPAVEVSLGQSDGNAFGRNFVLGPGWHETTVPLSQLSPMWGTTAKSPRPELINRVVFVAGAWYLGTLRDESHWVEVSDVRLVRVPEAWTLDVAAADAPFVLARPAERHVVVNGRETAHAVVPGMDDGVDAYRVMAPDFGEPPDSAAYRLTLNPELDHWRAEMARARFVVIKARAVHPQTNRVELVLIERDGSPWGTMDVPLTTEWQAIRLPLSAFRYFSHWREPQGGRGGPNDRLHPDNVQDINLCFGAWLYGEDRTKPHAFEVQEISLE